MDPSSIITQVSPTGNQGQQQPAAASPHDNVSGGNGGSNRENDAAAAAAHLASNTQKGSKKHPRRNFLCSLICCLGKKDPNGTSSRRRKDRRNSGNRNDGDGVNGGDAADLAVSNLSGGGGGGGSAGNAVSPVGKGKALLSELRAEDVGKKCIVIDLDETLVHSSFKPINNADFIVPVEIDGTIHQVYVLKRPHVDEFLCKMGELYECVLFTASLAKYADPVADLLDKRKVFSSRLFRESCVFHRGNYVKDLSRLGRELSKIIIVDNSPASYIFHPDNAVPCSSWFDDMNDRELLELIPFLEDLSKADGVYNMLHAKFKVGSGGPGSNSLASNGQQSVSAGSAGDKAS